MSTPVAGLGLGFGLGLGKKLGLDSDSDSVKKVKPAHPYSLFYDIKLESQFDHCPDTVVLFERLCFC